MSSSAAYMDRRTTGAIKGIALVLMFVHHMFAFPDFLMDPGMYPNLTEAAAILCLPTEMCVSIFAFLTGYFYAFCKTRTLRYSLRKVTDLYVSYWAVYLPMLAFAVLTDCSSFSKFVFAVEFTALRRELMIFNWYVLFYVFTMLLLPLLTRSREHTPAEDILLVLVLPAAVSSVLSRMNLSGFLYDSVVNIRNWFPTVACGYLFGKYDLFVRFFDRISDRVQKKPLRILLWTVLFWTALAGRYFWQFLHIGTLEIRGGMYTVLFPADIVLAPVFVYCAARLLQLLRGCFLFPLLEKLGHYSLLMWFIHCAYYNACGVLLQPIVYWPKVPVLVVIWGLFLSWLPAVPLDIAARKITAWKNKFL